MDEGGCRCWRLVGGSVKKNFKMIETGSNNFGIMIENKISLDTKIQYLEDKKDKLTSFKAVKGVY